MERTGSRRVVSDAPQAMWDRGWWVPVGSKAVGWAMRQSTQRGRRVGCGRGCFTRAGVAARGSCSAEHNRVDLSRHRGRAGAGARCLVVTRCTP